MAGMHVVDGLGALTKELAELTPKLEKKVLRQAMRKAAKPILAQAKANAPVGQITADTQRLVFRAMQFGKLIGATALILVNEGVMRAVYYLSILMLSATRISDEEPKEEISDPAYIRSKLSTHFKEFLENGRFPGERELFLNPEKMQLVNRISHFAYAFVVAHEFAHIIHSDFSVATPHHFMLGETTLEIFDKMKDEELQADLLAFQWLQYSGATDSISMQAEQLSEFVYCGIWLFYKAAVLLEKLYQFRPDTHPSAADREAFLRKNGWERYEEGLGLAGKFEVTWKACFDGVFEDL